jgi:hypothetical protein
MTALDRLRAFLHWMILFPFGIACLMVELVPPSPFYNQFPFEAAVSISYILYIFHFCANLVCRLRRTFLYLMIGLIILVSLNATGCVCFMRPVQSH